MTSPTPVASAPLVDDVEKENAVIMGVTQQQEQQEQVNDPAAVIEDPQKTEDSTTAKEKSKSHIVTYLVLGFVSLVGVIVTPIAGEKVYSEDDLGCHKLSDSEYYCIESDGGCSECLCSRTENRYAYQSNYYCAPAQPVLNDDALSLTIVFAYVLLGSLCCCYYCIPADGENLKPGQRRGMVVAVLILIILALGMFLGT